jgi:hypothetical protein
MFINYTATISTSYTTPETHCVLCEVQDEVKEKLYLNVIMKHNRFKVIPKF